MSITVEAMEAYLAQRYGGWATEQSMFMKLVEELGEVAEVLNKKAGRKASGDEDLTRQLAVELADMLHYLLAIAALNGIDMERVILEKDRTASLKYHHTVNLEQFLQARADRKDPV